MLIYQLPFYLDHQSMAKKIKLRKNRNYMV